MERIAVAGLLALAAMTPAAAEQEGWSCDATLATLVVLGEHPGRNVACEGPLAPGQQVSLAWSPGAHALVWLDVIDAQGQVFTLECMLTAGTPTSCSSSSRVPSSWGWSAAVTRYWPTGSAYELSLGLTEAATLSLSLAPGTVVSSCCAGVHSSASTFKLLVW